MSSGEVMIQRSEKKSGLFCFVFGGARFVLVCFGLFETDSPVPKWLGVQSREAQPGVPWDPHVNEHSTGKFSKAGWTNTVQLIALDVGDRPALGMKDEKSGGSVFLGRDAAGKPGPGHALDLGGSSAVMEKNLTFGWHGH